MLTKLHKNLLRVEGWLTFEDAELIWALLNLQAANSKQGNILEIGTYKGKSAMLLANQVKENLGEKLYLCDVFSKVGIENDNKSEIDRSYKTYELSRLQKLLSSSTPLKQVEFIDSNSLHLPEILANVKFRFIHIDGSHLYKVVKEDLIFAVNHLSADDSIICIDDYRAQHALGVAKAIWRNIDELEMRIIFSGPGKLFLRKRALDCIESNFIKKQLNLCGLEQTVVKEFGESYCIVKSKLDLSYLAGWKRKVLKRLVS